jgi:diguanylate cyclase (GGDEF)-like protein
MQEEDRLQALYKLRILDTVAEEEYDQLVRLAASICKTPYSFVSLVDRDRTWAKAAFGMARCESPRNISFCSHAIRGNRLLVVDDAATDPRFEDNPIVTGEPGIRHYAGMPIISPEGAPIGALCVMDRVPRNLTEHQREALTILGRQVQAQIELRVKNQLLEQALAENEERERKLTAANRALDLLATTDALTGLHNRRTFDERIAIEFAVARRKNRALAVLFIDIDDFKKLNDNHGHAAGDEALRVIGGLLNGHVRKGDMCARIGGEEFGYILTDNDSFGASVLARRIVAQVRNTRCGEHFLSVSIGVAQLRPSMQSWNELVARADKAMYAAKREGKDRVVVYDEYFRNTLRERSSRFDQTAQAPLLDAPEFDDYALPQVS